MKRISPLRLGLVFAGCFLGAGYVSGQELWQFFGAYGLGGYFGILLAVALLFLFGVLILRLAQITQETEMDWVVIPWNVPILRTLMGILELIFLFGVVAVMSAGIGALLQQLYGVPYALSSFAFTVLVLLVAICGLKGVLSAFSFSVPLLVLVTLLFGIRAVLQNDFTAVAWEVTTGTNGLLGNWISGAVNFACYNVFGIIGLMVPFAEFIPEKKVVYRGVGLGSLGLLLIALSVLICLSFSPDAALQQLPMLVLAEELSPLAANLYALLLALAMFGTSISSLVSLIDFLTKKFRFVRTHTRWTLTGAAALTFFASLYGFGDLIGVLYPIFGYCSAIFLLLMVVHYLQLKKRGLTR